jgi:hypothetical protein
MWCPELAKVPQDYIHDPWNMPKSLQKSCQVHIGDAKDAPEGFKSYPSAIKCDKYTSSDAAKKMKRPSGAAPKRGQSAPVKQSSLGSFVSGAKAPLQASIRK